MTAEIDSLQTMGAVSGSSSSGRHTLCTYQFHVSTFRFKIHLIGTSSLCAKLWYAVALIDHHDISRIIAQFNLGAKYKHGHREQDEEAVKCIDVQRCRNMHGRRTTLG